MNATLAIDEANLAAVQAAVTAYQQGHFLVAVPGLRLLAAANEDSAQAHFVLAMALEHGTGRDYRECYEHFERALTIQPGWFDALYNYGRILLYSSRELEAERMLRLALEQQPGHPGVRENLALSLLEQTRFEEALPHLERAVELMPDKVKLRSERDRVRASIAAPAKLGKIARFPRSAAEFADISKVIDTYVLNEIDRTQPFLHPESRVFTMGSCFAANIAIGLRNYGVQAEHVAQAEEINNTFANRYLAEWIAYGESEHTVNFAASFGEDYRRRLMHLLQTSDAFIISLGVAPCFFERVSGAFVPTHGTNLHTSLLIKEYEFRTTTVGENVANLTRIAEIVRAINPAIRIVITVSPVPLKATFERASPVIADCVSKSTLRVAAHEFASSAAGAGTLYWPSFEIFRWLGGHVGQVFGNDDGSPFHPDQGLIDLVLEKFVTAYGDARLRLSAAPDGG